MEEKKTHPNQYKEPHFTCGIHYGPDSDKYIREYQQMKAASFREVLETFNRTEMSFGKVFKKNNARGRESARDIRNTISHDWSVNDIQELIDR